MKPSYLHDEILHVFWGKIFGEIIESVGKQLLETEWFQYSELCLMLWVSFGQQCNIDAVNDSWDLNDFLHSNWT